MTDVTKLLATTIRENSLNQRTAHFQYRQEGIKLQIEDKGKPMSSLYTDKKNGNIHSAQRKGGTDFFLMIRNYNPDSDINIQIIENSF